MCGITGKINLKNEIVFEQELIAMRDAMLHRGPDDGGIWIENNVGLAHRRLSILDLSVAGHQPFISENHRFIIVYNGEVYNFRELKKELQLNGHSFKSDTDTEVILKLYEKFGPACLEKFNGMFAFSIWDREKKELFFARDRMGVKPFYYELNNNYFAFASEQKALFSGSTKMQFSEKNVDEFLVYRYVAGENTLFENIKKLLPGYYGVLTQDGSLKLTQWWNLGSKIQQHQTIQKPFDWFSETFLSSLKYRMISDVNVGVLLSAGLDSSSVVKGLKMIGFNDFENFNVGFRDKNHDESNLAEKLCADLHINFNKLYVEKEELFKQVQNASYFHDEPLVHNNDPQILAVSNFAKKKVSVLLSGEGADEIMGGYLRYKPFQYQKLWPILRATLGLYNSFNSSPRNLKLANYLKINNVDLMMLANGNNIFPNDFVKQYKMYGINLLPEYRIKILEEAKRIYPKNTIRQLLYLDQHTYLQSLNDRNDRATMGASIECREPFLDYRLVEGIGTLSNDYLFKGKKNKFILANSIGKSLPDYIRNFRKVGFSVPWASHFKTESMFREVIEELPKCDFFKIGSMANIDITKVRDEFNKNGSHQSLIIQLVFTSIWYKTYISRIKI